ncbi:MAG: tetratricopeptide repeat protein [Dehalococcoidia bacterium]|nr:tetratricopeptide repeat protein [Dehalococcoidia bacterium]
MEKKVELHGFLGLPQNATPEETEAHCEALMDWLASGAVPKELQPWASNQRAVVQEIYDSIEVSEEGTPDEVPAAVIVVSGKRARPKKARRSPLRRVLMGPVGLVTASILVGLVVVGALWWQGIIFGGAGEAQPSAEETFDPVQYLQSKQGRIQELERVVAANPKDAAALFELGETYITGAAYEQSINWFTKLLAVEPTNIHARLDIGTSNMELGRYKEAEATYAQVIQLEPDNVQAHFNAGFLFAFRSDSPDLSIAVKHWQEVVRLAPGTDLASVAQAHIQAVATSGQAP